MSTTVEYVPRPGRADCIHLSEGASVRTMTIAEAETLKRDLEAAIQRASIGEMLSILSAMAPRQDGER